jgi:hypothetical protein
MWTVAPITLSAPMGASSLAIAKGNLNLLCEIELLFGVTCILSVLEALNYLMKFLQQTTYFVSDMVVAIKLCQVDLFT